MYLPEPVLRRLAGGAVVVDGQRLHPEPQLTLRLLAVVSGPSRPDELTAEQARANLKRDIRRVSGRTQRGATATDTTVGGVSGRLRARLYVPLDRGEATAGDPLLVYFHGGGFVAGDLDSHDHGCRFLAGRSGTRVLAVDYRRAPEHPFPSALDDALAAFAYAVEHAPEFGADPSRVGVGGDSAGGNLAAGVALVSARSDRPGAAFQLLLYPWLDLSRKHPSYVEYGHGFYLEESELDWYRRQYLRDETDALDPRCSPLLAEDLAGAPPAYIATAGFDPLRDEGEAYAQRLRAEGVPVALRRHIGLFHGFLNTVDIGRTGREALLEAAGALRLGLADGTRLASAINHEEPG